MIIDTKFATEKLGRSIVTFPVNDFDVSSGEVCLLDFNDYLVNEENMMPKSATNICEIVRGYLKYKHAIYVDKESNICILL